MLQCWIFCCLRHKEMSRNTHALVLSTSPQRFEERSFYLLSSQKVLLFFFWWEIWREVMLPPYRYILDQHSQNQIQAALDCPFCDIENSPQIPMLNSSFCDWKDPLRIRKGHVTPCTTHITEQCSNQSLKGKTINMRELEKKDKYLSIPSAITTSITELPHAGSKAIALSPVGVLIPNKYWAIMLTWINYFIGKGRWMK